MHYSIPCLKNILLDEHLKSYELFVKSMYVLLTENLSEDKLSQCEEDILDFVNNCQKLYGPKFMTFNVHCLLHMAESVRRNGPLWATSAYPFESNLHQLKQDITGPKGTMHQIATRFLRRHNLQNYVLSQGNEDSWNFCKTIINKRKIITLNYVRDIDGALLIRNRSKRDMIKNPAEYARCILEGKMYHSKLYNMAKKTDNTYVYLKDGRVGQIRKFILRNDKTVIVVEILKIEKYQSCEHIWKVSDTNKELSYISLTDVQNKMVYISIEKTKKNGPKEDETTEDEDLCDRYVCLQPNHVELQ